MYIIWTQNSNWSLKYQSMDLLFFVHTCNILYFIVIISSNNFTYITEFELQNVVLV